MASFKIFRMAQHTSTLARFTAFAVLAFLSVAGMAKAEDDTSHWVQEALQNDPRVQPFSITITVEKGIVTLAGAVTNLAAKRYATQEAMKVLGVRGVVDRISVSPAFRWDTDIAQDVRRSILNSATVETQAITVTCKEGAVTLTGKVASWAEVQEAGLLASEIRGVRAVTNELWTEYLLHRSDQEIKTDAVAALNRDVYETGLPITVAVHDGRMSLDGSVGNAYEKRRAWEDVRWISGVQHLDNNLQVEWSESRGVRGEDSYVSDPELKQAANDALTLDPRVHASDLTVKVSSGVITLEGWVPNSSASQVAEQDARDVVGVGWVTNHLLARVEHRDDAAICEEVRGDFGIDCTLSAQAPKVTVKDGVVMLLGNVATAHDRAHASDVAARVRGVAAVVNEIAIASNRDDCTDAQLYREIQDRIRWNWKTMSVHDRIRATVVHHVVTLRGDVDTWTERQEAGRVALITPCVSAVENRLTVKGYTFPWDEWHYKSGPFSHSSP